MYITGGIILVVVAAVICLLLWAEIKIKISFSEEGKIIVRYLFFKYTYPMGKKKKTEKSSLLKSERKCKNKKPNYISTLFKEKGVANGISELADIIKRLFSAIFKLLSNIKILNLNIRAEFSEGDAASTAITYGVVSAVFYPLIGWLNSVCEVKKQNVEIKTSYTDEAFFNFNFETLLAVRVFDIICAFGKFIWEISVNTIKNNINKKG